MYILTTRNTGVTLLEYSLLIALIVLVSVKAISKIGTSIEKKTEQMNEDFPVSQQKK